MKKQDRTEKNIVTILEESNPVTKGASAGEKMETAKVSETPGQKIVDEGGLEGDETKEKTDKNPMDATGVVAKGNPETALKPKPSDAISDADVKKILNFLTTGPEQKLSEETQAAITKMFKEAVDKKVKEITEAKACEAEKEDKELVAETAKCIKEEATKIAAKELKVIREQLDKYLSYVAENFIKENEMALVPAIKVQLAENVLKGVKNLVESNGMNITEKTIEETTLLKKQLDETKAQLNKALDESINLRKAKLIAEACVGLSVNQSEKLKTISQNINSGTIKAFGERLQVIKEEVTRPSTKPTTKSTKTETIYESAEEKIIDNRVENAAKKLTNML